LAKIANYNTSDFFGVSNYINSKIGIAMYEQFIKHVKGTSKSMFVLLLFFTLFPIIYVIYSIKDSNFSVQDLLLVMLMTLGFALVVWGYVTVKEFLITERLVKRLNEINIQGLTDLNLTFTDRYTGWDRKLEYHGQFQQYELLVVQTFKASWFSNKSYLTVYMGRELDILTVIRIDKYLTAEVFLKEIIDSLLSE
jgi:hypothetical protein